MKRILILSLLCSPILLSAQGNKLHVQGQKQQAMGNAGTGFIQDGAAIYYNPGGVALLENNSVEAGMTAVIAKSTFRDSITTLQFETDNPLGTPITFYAVYGAKGSGESDSAKSSVFSNFKFGLGVYTPYGGSANYPEEWVGRYMLKSLNLKTINIQPTISYKFGDRLGVGAGFIYSIGSIEINKSVFATDSTNVFPNANIKGDLTGMGVNAGVYFKATDELSIGLSYKSNIEMKSTNGAATFTNIPSNLTDSVPDGNLDIMIPAPAVFTLGFGLKASEKLNFALDLNYVAFAVFDSLRIDFENNTGSLEDQAEPREMKDAYSINFGAQYMATEALALRFGLRYALTPIKNYIGTKDDPKFGDRVGPEGGDNNHVAYNLGLGYNIGEKFTIDASYAFLSIERKSNNNHYNFIGDYKTYASFAGLSLAYKF